jgi:hypothetical protein
MEFLFMFWKKLVLDFKAFKFMLLTFKNFQCYQNLSVYQCILFNKNKIYIICIIYWSAGTKKNNNNLIKKKQIFWSGGSLVSKYFSFTKVVSK